MDDHAVEVLAEGGGLQHRVPSSRDPRLLSRTQHSFGSSHALLHSRTRRQRPLAPLPTGVMVGAGACVARSCPRSIGVHRHSAGLFGTVCVHVFTVRACCTVTLS
jgi:hypothetical protein